MHIIYVLSFLIHLSYSQFNMTAFSRLPSLSFTQELWYAAIRHNSTEVYVSIRQGTASKIVKWNTTSATNVSRIGEYLSPVNIPWAYGYVYFFKGYILASAGSYKAQLFNETTFAYLGQFNVNLTFGRGEFLDSKNVFCFGTSTGNVGYFTINTLPNITPVYLFNETLTNFVFM